MVKLKLINALSYSGIVSANEKQPFVMVKSQKEVDQAVETGYFEVVNEAETQIQQEETAGDALKEAYTKSYLKKQNKDHQENIIIKLGGDPATTNNEDERIDLILELQDDTMLQLQEDQGE